MADTLGLWLADHSESESEEDDEEAGHAGVVSYAKFVKASKNWKVRNKQERIPGVASIPYLIASILPRPFQEAIRNVDPHLMAHDELVQELKERGLSLKGSTRFLPVSTSCLSSFLSMIVFLLKIPFSLSFAFLNRFLLLVGQAISKTVQSEWKRPSTWTRGRCGTRFEWSITG